MSEMMHVRIPPYNPAKGHVAVDRMVVAPNWKKHFRNGHWYPINKEVCDAVLAPMFQRDGDPSSGPLFQIVSLQQAKSIIVAEQKEALGQTGDAVKMAAARVIPDLVEGDTDLNEPEPIHQLQIQAEAQMLLERRKAAESAVNAAVDAMENAPAVDTSGSDDLLDGVTGVPKAKPKRKYTKRKATKKSAAKKKGE